MDDLTALDNLLDVLRLARKRRPIDHDLVHRIEADLRDFNGVDTVGLLTADVYQVARRRLAQGYTLAEVAAMTGLARSTVGNVRTGHRKPRKLASRALRGTPQVSVGA